MSAVYSSCHVLFYSWIRTRGIYDQYVNQRRRLLIECAERPLALDRHGPAPFGSPAVCGASSPWCSRLRMFVICGVEQPFGALHTM